MVGYEVKQGIAGEVKGVKVGGLVVAGVPIGGGTPAKLNAPLAAGSDVGEFVLSPDSRHVVFRADEPPIGSMELFSAPIAGGALTKLNGPLLPERDVIHGFVISPDSGRVIYLAYQESAEQMELFATFQDSVLPQKAFVPVMAR